MPRASSAHYGRKDPKRRNEQKRVRRFLLRFWIDAAFSSKNGWMRNVERVRTNARISKKNRYVIRDPRICSRQFNSSRSILSAWRDHIFSSPAKIVAETGNTLGDSGFFGCQALPGSHSANGKLRNWPAK